MTFNEFVEQKADEIAQKFTWTKDEIMAGLHTMLGRIVEAIPTIDGGFILRFRDGDWLYTLYPQDLRAGQVCLAHRYDYLLPNHPAVTSFTLIVYPKVTASKGGNTFTLGWREFPLNLRAALESMGWQFHHTVNAPDVIITDLRSSPIARIIHLYDCWRAEGRSLSEFVTFPPKFLCELRRWLTQFDEMAKSMRAGERITLYDVFDLIEPAGDLDYNLLEDYIYVDSLSKDDALALAAEMDVWLSACEARALPTPVPLP